MNLVVTNKEEEEYIEPKKIENVHGVMYFEPFHNLPDDYDSRYLVRFKGKSVVLSGLLLWGYYNTTQNKGDFVFRKK